LPLVTPDLKVRLPLPAGVPGTPGDPSLFDWRAEHQRQVHRFAEWKRLMPRTAESLLDKPALLAAGLDPFPVPFSRLTLAAQMEVLAQPIALAWERCAALNPFLTVWRRRAQAGELTITAWPAAAQRWLGGAAYARRFLDLAPDNWGERSRRPAGVAAQQTLLRHKLKGRTCTRCSGARPRASAPSCFDLYATLIEVGRHRPTPTRSGSVSSGSSSTPNRPWDALSSRRLQSGHRPAPRDGPPTRRALARNSVALHCLQVLPAVGGYPGRPGGVPAAANPGQPHHRADG
jgi:hypothetical protein